MNKKIDYLRIIALFVVLLGIFYFYFNLLIPRKLPNFMKAAVVDRPINILVLGTDLMFDDITGRATYDIGRTDTIMLMHYNPLREKINVLSIPRDSYVEIPGYYYTKINAAFVYGGIDLTSKTVEKMTGVKVDKYILMNTKGLAKFVDLLGGINIDIEKDMYYVDKAQGLYINLKKGPHKLSGKEAEGYIRFRHDALGDIGRISRQQNFLKALVKAAASPNALVKSPFIVGIIRKNIRSNLSLKEFILLGNTFRQLDLKEINTSSIPGEPANNEAGSVWMINYPELKKIIAQYF
ncbi:MAG: LCP family protein [Candidatus Margulisiibacteriota bacterium]